MLSVKIYAPDDSVLNLSRKYSQNVCLGNQKRQQVFFRGSVILTQMDSKKLSSTVSMLDLILAVNFFGIKTPTPPPFEAPVSLSVLCLIYISQRKYAMLLKNNFQYYNQCSTRFELQRKMY